MTAVVASMLYFPTGIVLVALCAAVGITAQSFLTFGGAVGTIWGMLVWWLVAFLLALPYAAWVFPWNEDDSEGDLWPRKK